MESCPPPEGEYNQHDIHRQTGVTADEGNIGDDPDQIRSLNRIGPKPEQDLSHCPADGAENDQADRCERGVVGGAA